MNEQAYRYEVFISYRWISPDQEWVRDRLFPALEAAGLKVCLDVEDFVPGRNLILEMERAGLQSRQVVCVISPEYFKDGRMVGFEELLARSRDPSGSKSVLIPLVFRQTRIPDRIRGLIPIDWTNSRHHGREWGKLLKALGARNSRAPHPEIFPETAVTDHITKKTNTFLHELEQVSIHLIDRDAIKIGKTLRMIPRAGKEIRIKRSGLKLPVRSVYDHIQSMAHSADVLRQVLDKSSCLSSEDIARCIVFHDIGEVLIGDYPSYTELHHASVGEADADPRYMPLHPKNTWQRGSKEVQYFEQVAAKFVGGWLGKKLQIDFAKGRRLRNINNPVGRYVAVLDKMDPIIGVWRYLFQYRNDNIFNPETFVTAMRHFFENPDVISVCEKVEANPNLLRLIRELQNESNASAYYHNSSILDRMANSSQISSNQITNLIEGRILAFVEH